MKAPARLLIFLVAAAVMLGAAERTQRHKSKRHQKPTGVQGRIYRVGGPAQRIDWTPPPFEERTPIVVLDSTHHRVKLVNTDSTGRFTIPLAPGTYYFIVKQSMIPTEEGPFVVVKDSLIPLRLSFDSGIR